MAACGDDDDAKPEATPTPTATSTADAATPEATSEDASITVEDSSGTMLTLDGPPQRIISYSPGATEILFAIGAGGRVVATDDFSDFPEEALALPKLTYSSPDPEAALALDPDLVIMSGQQADQVEQFRSLGMTVLYLEEAADIDGVFANIALFGAVTARDEDAAALVGDLQGRVAAVASALEGVEARPRVFFELTADLYTVAPNTFVGDLLTRAGAQNIAEGAESPFPQLSAEAIVDRDPEVVLLADAEFGETPEIACARPGWDVISACANARVHPVDGDFTSRPGPRIVEGLELIASLVHPDRFP